MQSLSIDSAIRSEKHPDPCINYGSIDPDIKFKISGFVNYIETSLAYTPQS